MNQKKCPIPIDRQRTRERSKEGTYGREIENAVLELLHSAGVNGMSIPEMMEFFIKNGPFYQQEVVAATSREAVESTPGAQFYQQDGKEHFSVPIYDGDNILEALLDLEAVGLIVMKDKRAFLTG